MKYVTLLYVHLLIFLLCTLCTREINYFDFDFDSSSISIHVPVDTSSVGMFGRCSTLRYIPKSHVLSYFLSLIWPLINILMTQNNQNPFNTSASYKMPFLTKYGFMWGFFLKETKSATMNIFRFFLFSF